MRRIHINANRLVVLFAATITSVVLYGLCLQMAHADTTNTFSGFLKDQNGNAIAGVKVSLRDISNNSVTSQTNSTGAFSVAVAPGTYSLRVYNDTWITTPSRLVKFSLAQPLSTPSIDLSFGSLSQDITLPLGKVSYTERNAQGYGTGYRKIIAKASASNTPPVSLYPGSLEAIAEEGTTTNDMTPNTDGTGDFTTIIGTTYQGIPNTSGNPQNGICTIVPSNPTLAECNQNPFTVPSATSSIDIPKPPLPKNTFTGKFRDTTGATVDSTKITLRDTFGNEVSGTPVSDGTFSIAVQPGTFSLRIEGLISSQFGVFKFEQPPASASIDLNSGNASQDLTLPVGIVNFTTINQNGGTIPYAKILAKGTATSPLSLYPGGPLFNPVQISLNSPKIFSNYQGIGAFKAILGSTYHGTNANDGVCTDASGITLCNTSPLVVGTNNIVIGPQ